MIDVQVNSGHATGLAAGINACLRRLQKPAQGIARQFGRLFIDGFVRCARGRAFRRHPCFRSPPRFNEESRPWPGFQDSACGGRLIGMVTDSSPRLELLGICDADARSAFSAATARIMAYWADECARDFDRMMA